MSEEKSEAQLLESIGNDRSVAKIAGASISIPRDVKVILCKVGVGIAADVLTEYEELMETENQLYRKWLGHLKDGEKKGLITNAEYKGCREILRGVVGTSIMSVTHGPTRPGREQTGDEYDAESG